jgi:hypothetical protein
MIFHNKYNGYIYTMGRKPINGVAMTQSERNKRYLAKNKQKKKEQNRRCYTKKKSLKGGKLSVNKVNDSKNLANIKRISDRKQKRYLVKNKLDAVTKKLDNINRIKNINRLLKGGALKTGKLVAHWRRGDLYTLASQGSYVKNSARVDIGPFVYQKSLSTKDYAVYINDKSKKIIIGVRGTDISNPKNAKRDLGADALIAVGLSKYSNRNKKLTKLVKFIKKQYSGYQIALTGHSLGGRVAMDVALSEKLVGVVFNPGTGPSDTLKGVALKGCKLFGGCKNTKNVLAVIVRGDPLSNLSLTYPNKKVISKKKDTSAHSLTNFL